jgi:hypothetical protein
MTTVDEWYENIDGSYGVYSSKHIIVGNKIVNLWKKKLEARDFKEKAHKPLKDSGPQQDMESQKTEEKSEVTELNLLPPTKRTV